MTATGVSISHPGSVTGVTFGAEVLLLIIDLHKVAADFY
jgi:hypothetical protein